MRWRAGAGAAIAASSVPLAFAGLPQEVATAPGAPEHTMNEAAARDSRGVRTGHRSVPRVPA